MKRRIITNEEIIFASKNTNSAAQAAQSLNVRFGTYKRHALKLGVYKTNQAGKGLKKSISDNRKFSLLDILDGKYPHYQTHKLRERLISEGIKKEKCEVCNLTKWLGNKIPLELDHLDGNCHNHRLENLRIICPNCHAQTDNYCGKNKSRK